MISACILIQRTLDMEVSSLKREDPTMEINDQLYPRKFSAYNMTNFEG